MELILYSVKIFNRSTRVTVGRRVPKHPCVLRFSRVNATYLCALDYLPNVLGYYTVILPRDILAVMCRQDRSSALSDQVYGNYLCVTLGTQYTRVNYLPTFKFTRVLLSTRICHGHYPGYYPPSSAPGFHPQLFWALSLFSIATSVSASKSQATELILRPPGMVGATLLHFLVRDCIRLTLRRRSFPESIDNELLS